MRESTRIELRRAARDAFREHLDDMSARFTEIARDEAQVAVSDVARRLFRQVEGIEERSRRAARPSVQDKNTVRVAAADAAKAAAAEVRRTVTDTARADIKKHAERAASDSAQRAVERILASSESDRWVRDIARQEARDTYEESLARRIEVTLGDAEPIEVSGDTHTVLPDVLLALKAGCHVFLVGPAGTGKSKMAQQTAEAFGIPFQALSLGPTTPMSKVFGYYDAHGKYHDTPFRRAFEHGGVMLLDELDAGHPGLLAELNQALALRVCAFADGIVTAHPDFRLVATGNTYGFGGDRQFVGRQALDGATLDRFVVIDVPVDTDLEQRLALAHAPARHAEVREILGVVRKARATAEAKRLPVSFSPRASIDSAKLLAAGASVEQAIRWRVTRGLSPAHRTTLGLGS
ncbi:AAA family ATPase [Amycolatopsis azurea]|uniref:AAA family ATPase n=1 Tax=Amycolatopsis azurea TaxID=36819 RepID=UPI003818F275